MGYETKAVAESIILGAFLLQSVPGLTTSWQLILIEWQFMKRSLSHRAAFAMEERRRSRRCRRPF
ncbi:hypothetical protein BT69DRAFT_1278136 [Atractiella rhizophila]|nr:hypothetical protein BT69DRAFT_1278136 [Atractiella rhizophila]